MIFLNDRSRSVIPSHVIKINFPSSTMKHVMKRALESRMIGTASYGFASLCAVSGSFNIWHVASSKLPSITITASLVSMERLSWRIITPLY